MKKTAFMIVYNDIDYVEYAIRSVLDWVDNLVIVEGAFQITMATGKPARSNDGTLDVLAKYIDNKKVFLKQVNLQEHKDHYDVGYQWAIENGADWAIMIDSDEVWTKSAKLMADSMMARIGKGQGVGIPAEILVEEYCFINDFKTWYPGTYPRIFSCVPGSKFVFDNEVQFGGCQRGRHPRWRVLGRDIYHYGYVRRKKRWEMKQEYMWEKDHNPSIKNDYKLEGNVYIIPKDLPIYQFAGNHPDIMKEHPFFDKTAEEIIYG